MLDILAELAEIVAGMALGFVICDRLHQRKEKGKGE